MGIVGWREAACLLLEAGKVLGRVVRVEDESEANRDVKAGKVGVMTCPGICWETALPVTPRTAGFVHGCKTADAVLGITAATPMPAAIEA